MLAALRAPTRASAAADLARVLRRGAQQVPRLSRNALPYASQAMRSAVRPSSAALRSHAQPRRAAPAPRLSAGARHMATQNAPVNRTLPKITFEQMDSWVRTSQPHCAPTQVSSIVRCSSPSASARLQTSMPARHRGMTLRLSLSL